MNKEKNCSAVNNMQNILESSESNSNSHETQTVQKDDVIKSELIDCDPNQCQINDKDDEEIDCMTGSYIAISYDQECSSIQKSKPSDPNGPHSKNIDDNEIIIDQEEVGNKHHKEKKRPNSLVLSKNSLGPLNVGDLEEKLSNNEKGEPWKKIHRSQQTSDSQATSVDGSPSFSSEEDAIYSTGHHRTGSDTSGISDLPGTVTVDGDMVSFVAEDLQEKIKLSSPVARWAGDSPSYSGSRSSTPSLYKQSFQPHFPVIDPGAITDLEIQARKVATCLDTMLENLSGTLQSISARTVECMETYETSVCKTCDSVDTSIKTMYQLMAKCEEVSNSVKPLYKISRDIKDIKKALDHFESIVEHKS